MTSSDVVWGLMATAAADAGLDAELRFDLTPPNGAVGATWKVEVSEVSAKDDRRYWVVTAYGPSAVDAIRKANDDLREYRNMMSEGQLSVKERQGGMALEFLRQQCLIDEEKERLRRERGVVDPTPEDGSPTGLLSGFGVPRCTEDLKPGEGCNCRAEERSQALLPDISVAVDAVRNRIKGGHQFSPDLMLDELWRVKERVKDYREALADEEKQQANNIGTPEHGCTGCLYEQLEGTGESFRNCNLPLLAECSTLCEPAASMIEGLLTNAAGSGSKCPWKEVAP